MAIPHGITRRDVEQALRDYRAGVPHPYRESIRYDLVVGGRRYPPKAIVGFAARRLNGGQFLDPDRDFSGGEGPAGANGVLRDLGYLVMEKGTDVVARTAREVAARRVWTEAEIEIIVAVYLAMLRAQLTGEASVKRVVVRGVEAQLPERTRGSIEFKFENVSAILHEEGLPWVEGYAPARNYQKALRRFVLAAVDGGVRADLEGALTRSPGVTVAAVPLASLEVAAPTNRRSVPGREPGSRVTPPWRGAFRDAANRILGQDGEAWVCLVEQERLVASGRPDLAELVEWVARTRGDGLGYDVLSFEATGAERWIEVKTTNAGPSAPFLLTPNELDVWRAHPDCYEIVRVFGYAGARGFYRIHGPPDDRLQLDTAVWSARPR
jgi:hypothetical protein